MDGLTAKTVELVSWGDAHITSTNFMFSKCIDLISVSTTLPLTITLMEGMFKGASSFNWDISDWNVHIVTNMWEMFCGATAFSQNLTRWDVKPETNTRNMFSNSGMLLEQYLAIVTAIIKEEESINLVYN